MKKYIDAERLRAEIESIHLFPQLSADYNDGREDMKMVVLDIIDTLQQEPTPDTIAHHTELVNLLKTYRIGEETAIIMADRIADTYGAQRYIDGLCDGLNEEDTKQEQANKSFCEENCNGYRDTGGKCFFGFNCSANKEQEQSESSNGKFVFPKFLYARTTNNITIDVAYGPQSLDAVEYVRIDYLQQECIYGRTPKEREKYCKFCSAVCNARVEQEQQEVDLEKEIDFFLYGTCTPERFQNTMQVRDEHTGLKVNDWKHWVNNPEYKVKFARHFYELGRNARKEDL